MDQAKATKAKETTANQKEKEATSTWHATGVANLATGHRTAESLYDTKEKEKNYMRQTKNKQIRTTMKNIPEDLNDAWDWHYEGEDMDTM